MQQIIPLSTEVAREINSKNMPSNVMVVFDRAIALHRNKRAFMGLDKLTW